MIRRLLPFILIAAFFLLDSAVVPALTSAWFVPVFSMALVHCLGLLMGRARGLLYGMIMGLLMDITVSTPLGLLTLIDALLGYAGGWFSRLMWRTKLAPVVSAAVCFTLYELIMDMYVIFMATQYDPNLFLRSLVRIPIYTALVYGGQFPLDRLLKPNRSRFAPR